MPTRRRRKARSASHESPQVSNEEPETPDQEQDSIAARTRKRRQCRIATQVSEAAVEAAEAAFAARTRADYAFEVAAGAENAAAVAEAAATMAAGLLEKALSEEDEDRRNQDTGEDEEEEGEEDEEEEEGEEDSSSEQVSYDGRDMDAETASGSLQLRLDTQRRLQSSFSSSESSEEDDGGLSENASDEEESWSQIADNYTFFMPRHGVDNSIGKYDIVRKLQWGGFGSVFHVSHRKTGKDYAMKVYRFGTEEHVEKELMLLMSIRHVNVMIVSKLRSFVSEVNDAQYSYVVMPLYPKDLSEYINFNLDDAPPSDADVSSIMLQICGGLGAVHAMQCAHADLKPENVLIDDTGDRLHVCLCDFGSVFDLESGGPYDPYGHTLALSSPELVCNTDGLIGTGVDIFPLACIYTELCTEQTLFYEREDECIYMAMVAQVNEEDTFPPAIVGNRKYFTRRGTLLGNAASKTAGAMQKSFEQFGFDSRQMALVKGCCRLDPANRWSLLQVVDWVKEYYSVQSPVVQQDGEHDRCPRSLDEGAEESIEQDEGDQDEGDQEEEKEKEQEQDEGDQEEEKEKEQAQAQAQDQDQDQDQDQAQGKSGTVEQETAVGGPQP